MNIQDAQKKVDERIQELGGYWPIQDMWLRFSEEFGELARAINLQYGSKRSKGESDGREVGIEAADVLFTLSAISNKAGINLEEYFIEKMEQDYPRDKEVYRND